MIKPIYVIFDEVAEIGLNPFPANNDADAIRTFEFTLNSNPLMNSRKGDFVLKSIGFFDTSDGLIKVSDDSGQLMSILDGSVVMKGSSFEKEGD